MGFHEATETLRGMADGRAIYLVYEHPYSPSRGRYGRLLAYLYATCPRRAAETERRRR